MPLAPPVASNSPVVTDFSAPAPPLVQHVPISGGYAWGYGDDARGWSSSDPSLRVSDRPAVKSWEVDLSHIRPYASRTKQDLTRLVYCRRPATGLMTSRSTRRSPGAHSGPPPLDRTAQRDDHTGAPRIGVRTDMWSNGVLEVAAQILYSSWSLYRRLSGRTQVIVAPIVLAGTVWMCTADTPSGSAPSSTPTPAVAPSGERRWGTRASDWRVAPAATGRITPPGRCLTWRLRPQRVLA